MDPALKQYLTFAAMKTKMKMKQGKVFLSVFRSNLRPAPHISANNDEQSNWLLCTRFAGGPMGGAKVDL